MIANVPIDHHLMANQRKVPASLSGFVISLNRRRTLMGINTSKGISIVEVLDGHEPVLGDSVAGPLDSLGCHPLKNVTQAIQFDALIQEIHDDFIRMRNMLDDDLPNAAPAR